MPYYFEHCPKFSKVKQTVHNNHLEYIANNLNKVQNIISLTGPLAQLHYTRFKYHFSNFENLYIFEILPNTFDAIKSDILRLPNSKVFNMNLLSVWPTFVSSVDYIDLDATNNLTELHINNICSMLKNNFKSLNKKLALSLCFPIKPIRRGKAKYFESIIENIFDYANLDTVDFLETEYRNEYSPYTMNYNTLILKK